MTPIYSGVLAAIVVCVFGLAVMPLREQWLHHRVRSRLVDRNPEKLWVIGRVIARVRAHSFKMLLVAGVSGTGLVALLLDGVGLAIVMTFLVSFVSAGVRLHKRRQRLQKYNKQLLRVLDSIVLSLRSGAGLIGGIREAAQAHEGIVELDLREVVRRLDLGVGFEDALQEWPRRCPLRSVRLSVACITLAYETGASSAQSIGAVRTTIRNALTAEAFAQAQAAQARASATMLAALPFVLSGPMLTFNHTSRAFMLHSPVGLAIMTCALTLDAFGLWWMSSMIARAQA